MTETDRRLVLRRVVEACILGQVEVLAGTVHRAGEWLVTEPDANWPTSRVLLPLPLEQGLCCGFVRQDSLGQRQPRERRRPGVPARARTRLCECAHNRICADGVPWRPSV
jgi:hypothetical protein